jgi:hypothetical protein
VTALVYAFFVLGVLGFGCSVAVHVLSWLGVGLPQWLMGLHVGIFVVFFPAILVARPLTVDFKQKDFWKAALRGAPPWVSTYGKVLVAYVFLHFFASMAVHFPPDRNIENFRIFSGHWMIFYGVAAALLYSSLHANEHDIGRTCSQGHPASAIARFCEQCGSAVLDRKS